MIENWWDEVDGKILDCLRSGPMSPADIARRTGMSEGEATTFLTMLVREGRVRMPLVEMGETPSPKVDGSIRRAHAA